MPDLSLSAAADQRSDLYRACGGVIESLGRLREAVDAVPVGGMSRASLAALVEIVYGMLCHIEGVILEGKNDGQCAS